MRLLSLYIDLIVFRWVDKRSESAAKIYTLALFISHSLSLCLTAKRELDVNIGTYFLVVNERPSEVIKNET